MPRAIWSGAVSFGLVNIPVKLVGAVTDRDLRFHMLHRDDGARIRFKRVCPSHGEEVPNEEIVKGYELARGQYVTFTDEELESVAPGGARSIDIEAFVALDEVDPAYYDKPYYLVPDKNADKAYALLLAAIKKTGRAGIARMVMRDKEHLVAIRARGDVLMLETMHFADEVVPESQVATDVHADAGKVDPKQLRLAEQLVEQLAAPFDPAAFPNRHREKVLQLVEAKAAGEEVVNEPAVSPAPRSTDLLKALESSLAGLQKPGLHKGGHGLAADEADEDAKAEDGKAEGKGKGGHRKHTKGRGGNAKAAA